MKDIWTMSLADYLEIYEGAYQLAKERGRKAGDNIETEFFEIAKKWKMAKNIKHLGTTDMDSDLLLGNIREETKAKVLDLTKGGKHV